MHADAWEWHSIEGNGHRQVERIVRHAAVPVRTHLCSVWAGPQRRPASVAGTGCECVWLCKKSCCAHQEGEAFARFRERARSSLFARPDASMRKVMKRLYIFDSLCTSAPRVQVTITNPYPPKYHTARVTHDTILDRLALQNTSRRLFVRASARVHCSWCSRCQCVCVVFSASLCPRSSVRARPLVTRPAGSQFPRATVQSKAHAHVRAHASVH